MADIIINESKMDFGPMPEDQVIQLETCKTYQRIQQGLAIAEFSYLKADNGKKRFLTIEAKSSSPRSGNEPDFSKYIREIASKLANGFQLTYALLIGRFGITETPLPDALVHVDLANAEHRLILVINGHQKSWLPPIQDALRQELKQIEKLWNLGPNSITVINDQMARQKGLIK